MPVTGLTTFANGTTADALQVNDNFNKVNAGVYIAPGGSLPGAPVDGQDYYYVVDSATGTEWHLKYRAGSPNAQKWELAGGQPWFNRMDTAQTVTAAAGSYQAGIGPTLTVPLTGTYMVTTQADLSLGVSIMEGLGALFVAGTIAAGPILRATHNAAVGEPGWWSVSKTYPLALTAGQILEIRYQRSTAGSMSAQFANISIIPRFVA